jgi:sugar/nucleoside kinase (ribokinase family)
VEVFYARAARLEDDLVADTTGAGDAFIGSICHGIATGMELGDAMRLGAYVAAKKCLKLGARPGLPKRGDVPSQLFEPYPDETP